MHNSDILVLYHRSKSLCTVTVETGWLSYALKDPGLFHSTLYHWALLNGDMTPVSFRQTDQLLKIKQVAIHSINERLQNLEISDEVIASVTCLASVNVEPPARCISKQLLTCQFLLGDAHEADMHFKGLHAMVTSRAGLCQLGFDGLIARLVRWYATLLGKLFDTQADLVVGQIHVMRKYGVDSWLLKIQSSANPVS
jgi:hypothetical protein